MRRVIAALAVAAAGLVIVPAAEAHYVINQQATCALVNNVPTITASADFAEFGSPDQDIHVTVGVDNAVPIDQRFPYAPAGGHWSASTPSTAGDHRVYIYITWKHYGTPNDSSYGPVTVTCPTPVPPPPPPPPPVVTPPTPPPPVVIVCNTKPMPAACGTPPVKPCGCKPRRRGASPGITGSPSSHDTSTTAASRSGSSARTPVTSAGTSTIAGTVSAGTRGNGQRIRGAAGGCTYGSRTSGPRACGDGTA
jgi:hypothetical protein